MKTGITKLAFALITLMAPVLIFAQGTARFDARVHTINKVCQSGKEQAGLYNLNFSKGFELKFGEEGSFPMITMNQPTDLPVVPSTLSEVENSLIISELTIANETCPLIKRNISNEGFNLSWRCSETGQYEVYFDWSRVLVFNKMNQAATCTSNIQI